MTLPDALFPVLLRAVSIAVDDRDRHLKATEREQVDTKVARQQARELREELRLLREVQALLLAMVLH